MHIVFAVAFFVTLAYGVFELRRWQVPEMRELLTPNRRARRVIIFLTLLTVIGMAFGGSFLPVHHVSRRMVIYELLFWCVWLVVAAIIPIAAIREFRATLAQQSLQEVLAAREAALKSAVSGFKEAELLAKRREEMPSRNGHG